MDKKSELAMLKRRSAPPPEQTTPGATTPPPTTGAAPSPSSAAAPQPPTGWWMYRGGPEHTGYVSDSDINTKNVKLNTDGTQGAFQTLHELHLGGPVLSVPAIEDGFIYVGLANYHNTEDGSGNGGALFKIDIEAGTIVQTFSWNLGSDARDTHSFTGMGCTPLLTNEHVYFGAFNGKFYCLDKQTLKQVWATDLRNEDLKNHNQPVTNINGTDMGYASAVIWTSPVISADGTKLYVGCGEGESPELYSLVFCLDTATGNVQWIYCTNQFSAGQVNSPNVLPVQAVPCLPPPAPFSIFDGQPIVMGCSVWGAIAYDKDLNRIYCPTGNQQPEPDGYWQWPDFPTEPAPCFKPELPSPGFSNGLLSLDADTGEYKAFFQVPHESNYRVSDFDIDIGSSPVIFNLDGQKVVSITCKNGGVFILNAETLEIIKWRQLLPYHNDGTWIETVDPHVPGNIPTFNLYVTNEQSNATPGENYSGVFNTPAHYPGSDDNPQTISPRYFIGMGGPNYHSASPGIDYQSTPFMRAIDLNSETLDDAWPMDNNDPRRYSNASALDPNINTEVGMYTTAGESGLGSPAVVNDVVFCATSKVSIYAFDVRDGTLLWWDNLGSQTDGDNGGYGYCIGPAIWKNYVVAGALIQGVDGGILRIYGLKQT
jgi:outer membrane protein assembly factor BamB